MSYLNEPYNFAGSKVWNKRTDCYSSYVLKYVHDFDEKMIQSSSIAALYFKNIKYKKIIDVEWEIHFNLNSKSLRKWTNLTFREHIYTIKTLIDIVVPESVKIMR